MGISGFGDLPARWSGGPLGWRFNSLWELAGLVTDPDHLAPVFLRNVSIPYGN